MDSTAERKQVDEVVSEEVVTRAKARALDEVASLSSISELEQAKIKLLGKKGSLTSLMKGLKDVDPADRKVIGALLNEAKSEVESILISKIKDLKSAQELEALEKEWIDVSLPVKAPILSTDVGTLHPLTRVRRGLEQIFVGLGFDVVDGPEIESEYYNFDALNIPDEHPCTRHARHFLAQQRIAVENPNERNSS